MRAGNRLLIVMSLVVAGCSGAAASPPPQTPAAEGPSGPANVDRFEYVAGEDEVDAEPAVAAQDDETSPGDGEFAVTSAERVHELAEEAVAADLNPKQQWRASPVMPLQWPTKEARVGVYFFPMAAHPDSTSHYELFAAAYVVHVSLGDGTAEAVKLKKRKRLGTIEITRPSMLERTEVATAEQALVGALLGRDGPVGEQNYWGYVKFLREHPKLARDLKSRAPAFVNWLHRTRGGTKT